jgi:hypothetical protein
LPRVLAPLAVNGDVHGVTFTEQQAQAIAALLMDMQQPESMPSNRRPLPGRRSTTLPASPVSDTRRAIRGPEGEVLEVGQAPGRKQL